MVSSCNCVVKSYIYKNKKKSVFTVIDWVQMREMDSVFAGSSVLTRPGSQWCCADPALSSISQPTVPSRQVSGTYWLWLCRGFPVRFGRVDLCGLGFSLHEELTFPKRELEGILVRRPLAGYAGVRSRCASVWVESRSVNVHTHGPAARNR